MLNEIITIYAITDDLLKAIAHDEDCRRDTVRSLLIEGREELMPYGSRKKPNSGSARTDTM